jgi:hypothetical protein
LDLFTHGELSTRRTGQEVDGSLRARAWIRSAR